MNKTAAAMINERRFRICILLLNLLVSSQENLLTLFIDNLQNDADVCSSLRGSQSDGQRSTRRQLLLGSPFRPAGVHEIAWIGEFTIPMLDIAFFIFYIEIDLGMRILEHKLRHGRLHRERMPMIV